LRFLTQYLLSYDEKWYVTLLFKKIAIFAKYCSKSPTRYSYSMKHWPQGEKVLCSNVELQVVKIQKVLKMSNLYDPSWLI
jgi:hypothetical protein